MKSIELIALLSYFYLYGLRFKHLFMRIFIVVRLYGRIPHLGYGQEEMSCTKFLTNLRSSKLVRNLIKSLVSLTGHAIDGTSGHVDLEVMYGCCGYGCVALRIGE